MVRSPPALRAFCKDALNYFLSFIYVAFTYLVIRLWTGFGSFRLIGQHLLKRLQCICIVIKYRKTGLLEMTLVKTDKRCDQRDLLSFFCQNLEFITAFFEEVTRVNFNYCAKDRINLRIFQSRFHFIYQLVGRNYLLWN